MWIWGGGLSKAVLDDAVKHFTKPALKPQEIGGDFKAKLLTTMSGGRGMPDITGVKGEDIAAFYPQTNQFVDLNTVGADKIKSQYLDWKWAQGTAPDGTQIGIPIDIGPTALFYRQDVFAEAGLPSEPADLAAAASTFDDYFDLGVELKAKLPDHFLVRDIANIFGVVVGSGTEFYVDKDDAFIGDQDHIRNGWDTAVKAFTLGIDGRVQRQQRPQRRVDQGHAGRSHRRGLGGAGHRLGCSGQLREVAGRDEPGRAGEHRRLVPGDPQELVVTGAGLRGHLLDPQPGERGPRVRGRVAVPGHPVVVHDARADQAGPVLRRPGDDRGLRAAGREDPGGVQQPVRRRRVGGRTTRS